MTRALGLALLCAAACTTQRAARINGDAGTCDTTQAPPAGDLPCDVSAVLLARCLPCHQMPPRHHAPFSEMTYEDLLTPFGMTGLVRWQRMAEVIEQGNAPHMPPRALAQLSDSDFATLRGWFGACAPPIAEGSGCDVVDAGPGDIDGGAD
jgi:hypothetical protein